MKAVRMENAYAADLEPSGNDKVMGAVRKLCFYSPRENLHAHTFAQFIMCEQSNFL